MCMFTNNVCMYPKYRELFDSLFYLCIAKFLASFLGICVPEPPCVSLKLQLPQ